MTLQENSSKINISCALMKSLLRQLRHLFVNSKILPFIGALIASYTVVEISVVSILMDYFSDSLVDDLRTAAILTNLLNGVSSLIFIFVSLISEAYTGPFTMITICAAASIEGLMLLWTAESSSSAFGPVYAAMLFLALGGNGHKLSENFLENQLEEILEAIKKFEVKDGRTKKQNEQVLIHTILMNMLLWAPLFVGYVGIFCTDYFIETYEELFKSAALLMGGSYLFFLFGRTWYIHELPGESNVGKIFRICKAAFGRRRSDYPTSQNCYYWKGNVRTDLCYEQCKEMRLKPRVPRLFRWLDKAAIVEAEDSVYVEVSPETQEREGKVCTVKEVREVKSLVPMIYLCFAFFAYSLLMATGNTFFVAQASSMKTTNSNDIARLFLIKGAMRRMSKFIFFFIMVGLSCMRPTDFISKRIAVTTSIIRIGFGMVCAVICSFIARKVEFHRLHLPLIKDKDGDLKRPMKTTVLVPQFMLLGLTEGLVEGGFKTLFLAHVAKPLWSFEDSYSELVNGIGKLLLIPIILFSSRSWFKESIDESHLDRFYLMLGILNAAFLLVFAYYSMKYTYKEICPKDEDAHQPHLQDSNQQDEEQDVENDEEQVKANVDEQDEENDEEQTNVEEQDEEKDEEQFEGNGEEQYEGNDDVNIFELIT